jgi:hypothetical protein
MIDTQDPGDITGLNEAAFTTDVMTGRVSAATVNVTSTA